MWLLSCIQIAEFSIEQDLIITSSISSMKIEKFVGSENVTFSFKKKKKKHVKQIITFFTYIWINYVLSLN